MPCKERFIELLALLSSRDRACCRTSSIAPGGPSLCSWWPSLKTFITKLAGRVGIQLGAKVRVMLSTILESTVVIFRVGDMLFAQSICRLGILVAWYIRCCRLISFALPSSWDDGDYFTPSNHSLCQLETQLHYGASI